MPFKSKKQMRFMFAKHPRMAKRWAEEQKAEHKSFKNLPEDSNKKVAEFIDNIIKQI